MIGKLIKAVKVAGPAVAGFAAGGPAGAVLAVTGQLAGAGENARAKPKGNGVNNVTAPTAAIAAPTLMATLLTTLNVPGAEEIAAQACGSPAAAGATFGGIAFVVHQIAHAAGKAASRG